MKIPLHDAGHMNKMAAMPIYGINTLKIFFPGTSGPISMKLGMKHQRKELYISRYAFVLILCVFTTAVLCIYCVFIE